MWDHINQGVLVRNGSLCVVEWPLAQSLLQPLNFQVLLLLLQFEMSESASSRNVGGKATKPVQRRSQEEQQWGLVQWLTSGASLDWFSCLTYQ